MTALNLISITKENYFGNNLAELVNEMTTSTIKTSRLPKQGAGISNDVLLIDEETISDQPENNLVAFRQMFPLSRQILFVDTTHKETLQRYLDFGCNCLVTKNESRKNIKKAILGTFENGFYLNSYFKTLLNYSGEMERNVLNIKGKCPQKMN